jgi:hypothetical protein
VRWLGNFVGLTSFSYTLTPQCFFPLFPPPSSHPYSPHCGCTILWVTEPLTSQLFHYRMQDTAELLRHCVCVDVLRPFEVRAVWSFGMAIQFPCPLIIFVFITAVSNSNAIFLLVFMRCISFSLNFFVCTKRIILLCWNHFVSQAAGFWKTHTGHQFIFQL